MDFDWRKMSKLTFPSGINETQYLQFEENGTWTASDKERICIMTNSSPAYVVAVLNAKMHPVNDEDRGHMVNNLKEWIQRKRDFLVKFGQCKSDVDVRDAHRGIERMEKEIVRLKALKLPY